MVHFFLSEFILELMAQLSLLVFLCLKKSKFFLTNFQNGEVKASVDENLCPIPNVINSVEEYEMYFYPLLQVSPFIEIQPRKKD